MADFQAIAQKYGGTSNWNALRGSGDPLFAGLDPSANWNAFRPSDTFMPGGSPSIAPTSLPMSPQDISPTTFPRPGTNTSAGKFSPVSTPYVFAGFDPSAHAGEDLTLNNPKYAVYNAVANALSGGATTKNFAPGVAQTLNQQFGTDIFHAIDNETLGYGDEYVHGAPVGYGLLGGQYDPTAPGEIFWGSNGPGPWNAAPTSLATPGPAPKAMPQGTGVPTSFDLSGLLGSLFGGASDPIHTGSLTGPGPALDPAGLNQIGNDPLSQLITSSLGGILQTGGTPDTHNMFNALSAILAGNGTTPDLTRQLVAARDAEAGAFQSQMADARAALANAGLVGEPGVPQGAEGLATQRISEALAPAYAGAVSDIESHGMDLANSRFTQAMSLATGLAQDQVQNILQAAGSGTARQQVLGSLALQTLEQDTQWQEFLATYGLNVDQVREQLQQGRIATLVPLLQVFLQMVNTSAAGFI